MILPKYKYIHILFCAYCTDLYIQENGKKMYDNFKVDIEHIL